MKEQYEKIMHNLKLMGPLVDLIEQKAPGFEMTLDPRSGIISSYPLVGRRAKALKTVTEIFGIDGWTARSFGGKVEYIKPIGEISIVMFNMRDDNKIQEFPVNPAEFVE